MSSEYGVRVERPFAVGQVRDGAGAVLREILPGVDAGAPEGTPKVADRRNGRRGCRRSSWPSCTAAARREFPATSW
jgi:hypothetical protein